MRRLLAASGADVTAEYYINDAGAQMDKFALSVLARAKGEPTPEGGYPGAYIGDLAAAVARAAPRRPRPARGRGRRGRPAARLPGPARRDPRRPSSASACFFDVWFSESELHDGGAVEQAVDRLREQGHVFDEDGAVWLRTTDFSDDKDRVLIRADGGPTYFAADAAYYLSKKDRGFTEKIYLLGADHHGYINRLKAIAAARR